MTASTLEADCIDERRREVQRSAHVALTLFRFCLFTGLSLHFLPAILNGAFLPSAVRTNEWNSAIFASLPRLPHGTSNMISCVMLIANAAACFGLAPRVASLVGGGASFVLASFNGLGVQTLALGITWALVVTTAICGDSCGLVFSWSRKRWTAPSRSLLTRRVLMFQILICVVLSGLEKIVAGWLVSDELGILLSYPTGFMVRNWVSDIGWRGAGHFTQALGVVSTAIEILVPFGMLWRRHAWLFLVVYQMFFAALFVTLEIPPLFYLIFGAGGFLLIDDSTVFRAMAKATSVLAS